MFVSSSFGKQEVKNIDKILRELWRLYHFFFCDVDDEAKNMCDWANESFCMVIEILSQFDLQTVHMFDSTLGSTLSTCNAKEILAHFAKFFHNSREAF